MTGKNQQRLFVLDTNVLMHDPAALFRFQEHDIFIPMVVLEELDASKVTMVNKTDFFRRMASPAH